MIMKTISNFILRLFVDPDTDEHHRAKIFWSWADFWYKLKTVWFWNVGFNFRPLSDWKSSGLIVFYLEETGKAYPSAVTFHLFPQCEDWKWGRFESWYDGPILDICFGPICSINFLWF